MNDSKAAAAYHPNTENATSEQTYTVRYHNPLFGTYETRGWDKDGALREAEYDAHMNGHTVEVISPDGTTIRTYPQEQQQ